MGTKHADIFKALAAEIPHDQVRVRQQRGGNVAYITARVAQNRLDTVIGPENWRLRWRVVETITRDKSTVVVADCAVQIRIGDDLISRRDTGGSSNPDPIVARKGAVSDAFKRACALFGIGRELYGSGIAEYEADELASLEGPPAPPSRAEEPARPRPSERKAEEKKKAPVADTKLASLVTPEQLKAFREWRDAFIAEEVDRLLDLAADPKSGELPAGWKAECNKFLLVKHFIDWLKARGTLGDVGSDGAIRAKCVAWVWSNKRADFDAELESWREKLRAEATAWQRKPAASPATPSPAPPAGGPNPFEEGRANPLAPNERAQDGEVAQMRDALAELGRRTGLSPLDLSGEVHRRMLAAGLVGPEPVEGLDRLRLVALARVFWPHWLAFQIENIANENRGATNAA